jgi:uracil phosphoribosyltransferase
MRLHVVDHPLVSHKLTTLRDQDTASPEFRRLTEELVTLLAYEATRDVRVEDVTITTPVSETSGVSLSRPRPLVVPILRAGLGMLEGMMRLMPTAEVGFLGMVRNEETLEASTYAERLPADLSGRQCYVLDPMLATGGTLAAAIRFLTDRGADHITCISTRRATSSRGSATPGTGCTGWRSSHDQAGTASAVRGRVTETVVPCCGVESRWMAPPCRATMARTMVRPRPAPWMAWS